MARKAAAKPTLPNVPELSKEQELSAYRDMLLIRRFEEKAGQMYGMGLIGGFCHLYIGQEAVVTGVTMASRKGKDAQITGYRDHGHMLAMGLDPKAVMAELTGRRGGLSKGKGGSMHMFSNEHRFYGGNGIVGAQASLGTGLAFAARYRGDDTVSLTYFGDGAANQGQVYESFNMAKLWKLPVIYIIENNKYGMGTAVARASAVEELHQKAAAYDMRNEVVESGYDVLAVHKAVKAAVDHARATYEPSLLEIQTFRYRGHSMSDPVSGHYRTKEEVETQKKLDPLVVFAESLKRDGLASDEYFENAEKRIKAVVDECVEFAENSPEPPADELWKDVYFERGGF